MASVTAILLVLWGGLQAAPGFSPAEARLLRLLQSDATAAEKDAAFRELALIATDTSIPVLAPMLARAETAEMARFVIARITGPGADEALRQALEKAEGNVKIGIISSLGQRRDAKSVPALSALISRPELTEAVAAALANIADRPALDALATARTKVSGCLRQRVTQAYLECADHLGAGGVYQRLTSRREPPMVRIAALARLATVDPKHATRALAAEMRSKDRRMRAEAIRILSEVPDPEVTELLIKAFPKLAPDGQVVTLSALADRGDAAARPLATEAVRSKTAEVRAAALAALGKLGDASSVMLLAEAGARQSLYALRGPGVDDAITAAIGSATGKVKAELVMAAGERGITAAANVLAAAAHDTDPDVRREALRALKNVAGSAQLPVLLDLLVKASTAAERKEATQALGSILKRVHQSGAVIAAYEATSAFVTRISLIEALGQAPSEEALRFLRGALKDPDREIARAAILALSGWDSPAPLMDLLAVAKSGASPVLQVLALRGHLKLLALPSERSAAESTRLLSEAMRLANQPAEKRTILSLLPAYPCEDSLRLAEAGLADESVAKEAQAAADKIRSALNRKP